MKKTCIFMTILLAGCTAKQISYSPADITNIAVASSVIEQIIMEQPTKYRPAGLIITSSYLGLSEGVNSKGIIMSNYNETLNLNLASTNLKLSDISSRYYFNSISSLELYHKRNWFIIQLKNNEKQVIKRFYTMRLDKAQRFIDSINYMKNSAKPFGTE